MTDKIFDALIKETKTSDIYENQTHWEARGLNPSDKSVIQILRKATNSFLEELEKIHHSNASTENKLIQISNNVDSLPWDDLDSEEKDFMAEVLAPAIEAAGFNPWTIF